jgi:hypothetical protein
MRRWIALLVPLMIAAMLLLIFSLILRFGAVPLVMLGVLVVGAVIGAIQTRDNPRGRRVLVAVLWALAVLAILAGAVLYAFIFMLARSMR